MSTLHKYKNTLIVCLLLISISSNIIVFLKLSEVSLIYTNYFIEKEDAVSKEPFLVELYDNIYGYVLFHKIGKQLVKGQINDKDKILAASDWVFNNILQEELVPSVYYNSNIDIPIIDDNFLNIVRRGYGYCDQSAYVLCAMMHWLGFKSKMLMLRNEKGETPHTVAVVTANGKEYIIDTTVKFIFLNKDGEPISIKNLKNYPEVFLKYTGLVDELCLRKGEPSSNIKTEWFEKGTFFETFPFCSRAVLLEKIKEKISGPFVSLTPRHSSKGLNPAMNAALPREGALKIGNRITGEKELTRTLVQRALFVPSAFASETPPSFHHPIYVIRVYDNARINCLLGNLEKALKILNSVKINKDNKAYIHFLFEKGYILYRLKRYQEAREYFSEMLTLEKPHFLKNGTYYFLNRIKEVDFQKLHME